MSTSWSLDNNLGDMSRRLGFFKNLQRLTNKIHGTDNADEIVFELSEDICGLFHCERLTIYLLGDDRQSIVAKVKTGLAAEHEIRLPICEQSIAGYVAATGKTVNIRDVHDQAELLRHSPSLRFLDAVDRRTGYRSRQMLVAPICSAANGELLGVVQLLNSRSDAPFPVVAEEGVQALAQTLAVAFAQHQKARPTLPGKYDALVSDAVISTAELDRARQLARQQDVELEELLSSQFAVKRPAIGAALEKFFGVPYEPFRAGRVRPLKLLKDLPVDSLAANRWLPIGETAEGVVVMAVDPEQLRRSRAASAVFPDRPIAYRVTTQREFAQSLGQFFGAPSPIDAVAGFSSKGDADDASDDGSNAEAPSGAADTELARLVNKVIVDACQQGVSDIHIEPRPGLEKMLIRFRRGGALARYSEVPAAYRSALIARIKIMSDLDPAEHRRPQHGEMKFKKWGPLDIDLRVATLPTAGGIEDVVLRIVAAGEPIGLDDLGITAHDLERLQALIDKPHGLFFVCGPAGSGKTTTLHAIVSHLNRPETKIWTAEDPVEITHKGLRQVQVDQPAGLDFAAVLRAILRADADVIMVGEMRDRETLAVGIEASLSGHLVLAGLHTGGAAESIRRLLDIGIDRFSLADALLGILAQRLARRLCKACREAYQPTPEEFRQLLVEYADEVGQTTLWQSDPQAAAERVHADWLQHYASNGRFTLYRARSCDACAGSGYQGWVGVHELLTASEAVKQQIQQRARVAELHAGALNEGMRTLKMDGIEKVLAGIIDLKQLRAVCSR